MRPFVVFFAEIRPRGSSGSWERRYVVAQNRRQVRRAFVLEGMEWRFDLEHCHWFTREQKCIFAGMRERFPLAYETIMTWRMCGFQYLVKKGDRGLEPLNLGMEINAIRAQGAVLVYELSLDDDCYLAAVRLAHQWYREVHPAPPRNEPFESVAE